MNTALKKARILLPTRDVDLSKWAVVACDQFTSQPSYWNRVAEIVGDAPSTLKLTLPEMCIRDRSGTEPKIKLYVNAVSGSAGETQRLLNAYSDAAVKLLESL